MLWLAVYMRLASRNHLSNPFPTFHFHTPNVYEGLSFPFHFISVLGII